MPGRVGQVCGGKAKACRMKQLEKGGKGKEEETAAASQAGGGLETKVL